jgi:hypothetical protein
MLFPPLSPLFQILVTQVTSLIPGALDGLLQILQGNSQGKCTKQTHKFRRQNISLSITGVNFNGLVYLIDLMTTRIEYLQDYPGSSSTINESRSTTLESLQVLDMVFI